MDANDFFRQFVNHIKHAMKWYSRWSTANQILIEEQKLNNQYKEIDQY